jgi:hypothetical protein
MGSEPGSSCCPGMSLADTCLLARRSPAERWREPGSGSGVERGRSSPRNSHARVGGRGERENPKQRTCEGESTGCGGRKSDHLVVVVGVTSHQGGRESRPQGEGDGLLGYATCQPDDVRDEQGDFVNQRCWEEPSEHVRCSGEVV